MSEIMSLEDRLLAGQNDFDAVSVGPFKPEIGTYKCVIQHVQIQTSKLANAVLQLMVTLSVFEGECSGKTFNTFIDVEGDYIFTYKNFLTIMGVDLNTFKTNDIINIIKDGSFIEKCVVVDVRQSKKNKEFNNIYITKQIEPEVADTTSTDATPGEAIPF